MKNTLTIVNEETGDRKDYISSHENIEDFFQFVSAEIKKSRKIELKECLQTPSGKWMKVYSNISLFDYSKFELNENYSIRGMDLIYATHNEGGQQIWLGHWNEGEVL